MRVFILVALLLVLLFCLTETVLSKEAPSHLHRRFRHPKEHHQPQHNREGSLRRKHQRNKRELNHALQEMADADFKINECQVCQYAVKGIKLYGPAILNEKNRSKICSPLKNFSGLCDNLILKFINNVHDKADPLKVCTSFKMCTSG